MNEADNSGSGPSPMLVRTGQVIGWAGVIFGVGFAIISALAFFSCFTSYRCEPNDESFVAGALLLLAGLGVWVVGGLGRYIIDGTKPWPLSSVYDRGDAQRSFPRNLPPEDNRDDVQRSFPRNFPW